MLVHNTEMSLEDNLYPLLRLYEAAPQPVKSLAGRVYRALPARVRYGSAFQRFQSEARGVESWDAQEIERYQVAAIRESLLAAAEAPLYRDRFAAFKLEPKKFESLEQLKDYPVLTKQDLIEHREALANPRFGAAQRLYITTVGSSGVPVGFYLHKGVSRPKEQAYLEAQWGRRGWRAGERTAVIRGMVTSSTADGRISSYDATRNWLILSSYHLTDARAPEYLAALNRFRPQHLHAYPSAALMLARWMEAEGKTFEFPLTSVLCGSEKLTAEAQAYLERVFGARVLHWYGHSERVVLAAEGRTSNHLYFWPTYGYAELGEENADGHREIIGTSFHNHVMPLVRYRTGDFVKVASSSTFRCRDSGAGDSTTERRTTSEFPWLEVSAVVGRDYEFLVSATGRRISLTAINMHDRIFDGLYAVQFAQEQAGMVEFRYQAGPQWHAGREENIRAGLLKKLGNDFNLELRSVPEVEKTKGGKARWLISELRNEALARRDRETTIPR
jgi:phenylacetate-CoA ligase